MNLLTGRWEALVFSFCLADVGEVRGSGFEGYLGDVGGEADGVVPAAEHGEVEDLLLVEGC